MQTNIKLDITFRALYGKDRLFDPRKLVFINQIDTLYDVRWTITGKLLTFFSYTANCLKVSYV